MANKMVTFLAILTLIEDLRSSFPTVFSAFRCIRFESCRPDENLIPEVRCLCGFRDFYRSKNTPEIWLRLVEIWLRKFPVV